MLAYWREPGAGPARSTRPRPRRWPGCRSSELADPANRGQVRQSSGFIGPAFRVADLLVWGFTAGLVDTLLELGGWSVPWDRDRVFELPTVTDERGLPSERARR